MKSISTGAKAVDERVGLNDIEVLCGGEREREREERGFEELEGKRCAQKRGLLCKEKAAHLKANRTTISILRKTFFSFLALGSSIVIVRSFAVGLFPSLLYMIFNTSGW